MCSCVLLQQSMVTSLIVVKEFVLKYLTISSRTRTRGWDETIFYGVVKVTNTD